MAKYTKLFFSELKARLHINAVHSKTPIIRTVLGLDFVLGLREKFGVVSPNVMRGQLSINMFVTYNYSANHMSLLYR